MDIININEAKAVLSKLIDQALAGEEVVISRAGKPMVRLIPFISSGIKRQGGQWQGLVEISDDFDQPLPEEIAKAFRGEGA